MEFSAWHACKIPKFFCCQTSYEWKAILEKIRTYKQAYLDFAHQTPMYNP